VRSRPGGPRPLNEEAFPYVFLDATYYKVRSNQRVVSRTAVIATGVSANGILEVLGCAGGDSETKAFWTGFLRDLRDRRLRVQLVISDADRGLTDAVTAVLQGAAWQRCRVHFMRNTLAKVSNDHTEMVAATIRMIFAQPTGPRSVSNWTTSRPAVREFPAAAHLLRAARSDPTAFADFPLAHWQRIWSMNPLERLNREVKRCPRSSGSSPPPTPCSARSLRADQAHDEWQDSDRRNLAEGRWRCACGIVARVAESHATSYTTPRGRNPRGLHVTAIWMPRACGHPWPLPRVELFEVASHSRGVKLGHTNCGCGRQSCPAIWRAQQLLHGAAQGGGVPEGGHSAGDPVLYGFVDAVGRRCHDRYVSSHCLHDSPREPLPSGRRDENVHRGQQSWDIPAKSGEDDLGAEPEVTN
jgi:hypothetical protein